MTSDCLPVGTELPHPCPDCGSRMLLRKSRYGLFYACVTWPACPGAHGAHRTTGQPLGVPANKATKAARIEAHAAFDRLWKTGLMSRSAAYRWLASRLGLTADQCHIGRFDEATCRKVVKVLDEELARGSDAYDGRSFCTQELDGMA